jgi:hypothetical protein
MALESSQGELQLWLRPRPDPSSRREDMDAQSPMSPQPGQFRDSTLGVPGKKNHLDVASVRSCREYYKGEGGGFP